MARKYIFEEFVTDEIKELIPQWKRQGQKDEWIAKQIGIGITKLKDWKNEFPSFEALFKKGKAQLMLELEETLYTRAKGYTKSLREYRLDNNGKIIPQSIRIKETYIWSDKCLEMALRKLAPDKWGDHALGNGDTVLIIDDLRKKVEGNGE